MTKKTVLEGAKQLIWSLSTNSKGPEAEVLQACQTLQNFAQNAVFTATGRAVLQGAGCRVQLMGALSATLGGPEVLLSLVFKVLKTRESKQCKSLYLNHERERVRG